MKIFRFIFLLLALTIFVADFRAQEPLKFKAEIGFAQAEDQIVEHQFLEGGKKLLLIGQKKIQLWDVDDARLINSVAHDIPQFAPKGFISDYILLGLPEFLAWKPYAVEPNAKWIVTVEAVGDKKTRSAIVRDLTTMKRIAALDLPNVSIDYVVLDEANNELLTLGQTDKTATFANWNPQTFALKRSVSIADYKWHRYIKNGEKMLVGSGDTKVVLNFKQGARLTLRDAKTGAIEKEYTAQNLLPDTAFQETTVSADEKFLMSKRNDRIFVWAIDGDGAPRFEISAKSKEEDPRFKTVAAGRYIVIAVDKKLRVYDFAGAGAPKFEFASENPKDSVNFADATDDGRFIVVTDDDKVSVIDAARADSKPVYEIKTDSEKERFSTVKILQEENYLAVSRSNRSEKKPDRTEIYAVETGKIVSEIPDVISYKASLTPDRKFLISEYLGGTYVWNFAEKRGFTIPLEFYTPPYDPNATYYQVQESPYNTEHTSLAPNGKLILRYGGALTTVFDMETGKEVQTVFDPQRVKYNKQGKIKKSGFDYAGWTEDGKHLYAFYRSGLSSRYKTISFWRVLK